MGMGLEKLWKTEDHWAVWLGLGVVSSRFESNINAMM